MTFGQRKIGSYLYIFFQTGSHNTSSPDYARRSEKRTFYFAAFLSEERYSTRSTRSCVDMVCCRTAGMMEVLSCWRLVMSLFLMRVAMALGSLMVNSSAVSLTMMP